MEVIVTYKVKEELYSWSMWVGKEWEWLLGDFDKNREMSEEETKNFKYLIKILKTIQLDYYGQHKTKPELVSMRKASQEDIDDWERRYHEWVKNGKKGVI